MLRTQAASCSPADRDSRPRPSLTFATCRDSSIARLPLCGAAQARVMVCGLICHTRVRLQLGVRGMRPCQEITPRSTNMFLQGESAWTESSFVQNSMGLLQISAVV